jgi:parallel beta-helix repeat protein
MSFVLKNPFCQFVLVAVMSGTLSASAEERRAAPATEIDAAVYPTLQAAIDALPAGGGLVRLPAGRFELREPLVLGTGDSCLRGAGPATHIVNLNTDGQPALVIRPRDKGTNRSAKIWRVQVENFRISGNPKSGDGILAHGVNEFFVHGVSVDHHGAHGVHLWDCYEDARVASSIITYNGAAGLNIAACHDIVVNANQFEENQDAVRCIDSFNLCMNGNNIDDHLRHGIVIERTNASVLSGNMIEECKGAGIILDRDAYGITLSANVIARHLEGGILFRQAWGCTVSANTFLQVRANALFISAKSGRLNVTGNTFSNNYYPGRSTPPTAATGIVLEGATDVVIAANQFAGLAGSAITATGQPRRLAVHGNVVTDWGAGAPEKPPAIDIRSTEGNDIRDNLIGTPSAQK